VKNAIEKQLALKEHVDGGEDADDAFPDARGKRLAELESRLSELAGDDNPNLLSETGTWGADGLADPTEKKIADVKTKVETLEKTTQDLLKAAADETEQLKSLAKINQAKNEDAKAEITEKTHELLDVAREEAAHLLDPSRAPAVNSQAKLDELFPQVVVKNEADQAILKEEDADGDAIETAGSVEKTVNPNGKV
jgi:hypothetical protein